MNHRPYDERGASLVSRHATQNIQVCGLAVFDVFYFSDIGPPLNAVSGHPDAHQPASLSTVCVFPFSSYKSFRYLQRNSRGIPVLVSVSWHPPFKIEKCPTTLKDFPSVSDGAS